MARTCSALDPETAQVHNFPLPDPVARVRRFDPSGDGIVWFANSTPGRIDRLSPAATEITEWDSPGGPTAHSYALAVIDDKVWYNESGMRPDALVRFDPDTEEVQSRAIPSCVGIVRNMWQTRGNTLLILLTSSRVGMVTIKELVN